MARYHPAIQTWRFNELSRPLRETLVHLLTGGRDDRLLFGRMQRRTSGLTRSVLLASGLIVAALSSSWLRSDPRSLDRTYAVLASLGAGLGLFVAAAMVLGIVRNAIWEPPPWGPFALLISPGYLVIVQDAQVLVLPNHHLGSPVQTDFYRRGSYQYSQVTFSVGGLALSDGDFSPTFGSRDAASSFLQRWASTRTRFEAAGTKSDAAMDKIDPFGVEVRKSGWRGNGNPGGSIPRVVECPRFVPWLQWLLPLALAGVVGISSYNAWVRACPSPPGCPIPRAAQVTGS